MILGVITDDYYPHEGYRWGGTGWARIGKYLPWLPQEWDIHVASSVHRADENGLSIIDRHGKRVYPDVIWCQRVFMPNIAGDLMIARSLGQRVVTDLDDMLWEVPKGSIADKYWNADQIMGFIQTLAVSDAVITSTKWLAARLMSDFKIPSLIILNTVDIEHFDEVHHNYGKPYLGWAGCPAVRPDDMDVYGKVLDKVYKKVKIQHSGDIAGMLTFEETTGHKPDRILPVAHPSGYADLLNFHIGAVPLSLNNFNRAKSDIKGIEYAAAGIPFVASPMPAYKQLQKEWGDVVRLARTPEEWEEHITDLLDFETRRAAGEELRKKAWLRDLPTALPEIRSVLLG